MNTFEQTLARLDRCIELAKAMHSKEARDAAERFIKASVARMEACKARQLELEVSG